MKTGCDERHRRIVARGVSRAFSLSLLVVLAAGCSAIPRHEVSTRAPEGPATPWIPPDKALPHAEAEDTTLVLPEGFLERKDQWTLDDIVELALQNNPATRATWQTARAAAAHVGSEQGAYFPQVSAAGYYSKTKSAYSQQLTVEQKAYQPSLALQFILFDFGKRRADVEEARQTLYAANWTHNAMIQAVILEVETQYYQYLNAKAVCSADSAAVHEAGVNLDAAEERHKAGLATVADVLQARSNYAQQKLALEMVEGQIHTIRGSLATAMGLPPTIDYDIGFLPSNIPVTEVTQTVDELLDEAQVRRPDLAASRATALAARANLKSVKSEGLPEITLEGVIGRRYYDNPRVYNDNYTEGIFFNVPLFTGFSHTYDVIEARAKEQAATQRYEVLKGRVDLDVWSSYYDLKTAAERLDTSHEFLASATESYAVSLERYKAGVGSILELLSAQSALGEARAQDVQARTDWFLALAGLAHATGRLELKPPRSPQQSPDEQGRNGQ